MLVRICGHSSYDPTHPPHPSYTINIRPKFDEREPTSCQKTDPTPYIQLRSCILGGLIWIVDVGIFTVTHLSIVFPFVHLSAKEEEEEEERMYLRITCRALQSVHITCHARRRRSKTTPSFLCT